MCFSFVKVTVYNSVLRGEIRIFTGSKYCMNYFLLELKFSKFCSILLNYLLIFNQILCFHKFSCKVIRSSYNQRWEQRTKQNWFYTSLGALLLAMEKIPSPELKRSTKNWLQNNLGNNLTLVLFLYKNFISFRYIRGELTKLKFPFVICLKLLFLRRWVQPPDAMLLKKFTSYTNTSLSSRGRVSEPGLYQ